MIFKWFSISLVSLIVSSCKPGCGDDVKCWVRRMSTEAFDENGFNVGIAKQIITDAPKEPDNLPMLNNKQGPIGAALMVSLALDQRPTSKQRIDLHEWAKKNKKHLGFDIENLRDTDTKETESNE